LANLVLDALGLKLSSIGPLVPSNGRRYGNWAHLHCRHLVAYKIIIQQLQLVDALLSNSRRYGNLLPKDALRLNSCSSIDILPSNTSKRYGNLAHLKVLPRPSGMGTATTWLHGDCHNLVAYKILVIQHLQVDVLLSNSRRYGIWPA
jgi:hypothetical protein